MVEADYQLVISDVTDGFCTAQFADSHAGQSLRLHVALDDHELAFLPRGRVSAEFADALDLALAVYIADRLASSRTKECRRIHVVLPARHPEVLGSGSVQMCLADILHDYTRDIWSFEFCSRQAPGRLVERQPQPPLMPYPGLADAPEVALWSGGLDGLAGFYYRRHVQCSANGYALIGTGGNPTVWALQRSVVEAARRAFPHDHRPPPSLFQVRIQLTDTGKLRKNRVPRARGFVFLLVGSICAALANRSELNVYENGIGAINLPFRASEVGIDHSKAVHPIAIRKMGELLTQLFGSPFSVRNPFEFMTKAQLCIALLEAGVNEPMHVTMSCDRRHRAIPTQCGRCSSCLLRRQALAVNGMIEPADRYIATAGVNLRRAPHRLGALHLQAMLEQVERLRAILSLPNPWPILVSRYPDLADLVESVVAHDAASAQAIQTGILSMYRTYIQEWDQVRRTVAQGLLPADECSTQ